MRHLASFVFPLLTLAFVATGPHRFVAALPGIAIVAAVVFVDKRAGAAKAPPVDEHGGASWPFTLLAVTLALVQLVTLALLVRMIARHGWSWDLIVVGWFVGNNSGWGSLVVAHELIHRRSRALRLLGRALLCTVLYDHFFVEHLRGHHVRVATPADPATARFGESYNAFLRRTVPAQLAARGGSGARRCWPGSSSRRRWSRRSPSSPAGRAWSSSSGRRTAPSPCSRRSTTSSTGDFRVGPASRRRGAWDTDSWLTHYSLIGLSRHADHHAHAARPFEKLRPVDESPKLPGGYYAMVTLAQMRNRTFRELMTAELRKKKLGPFAAS